MEVLRSVVLLKSRPRLQDTRPELDKLHVHMSAKSGEERVAPNHAHLECSSFA